MSLRLLLLIALSLPAGAVDLVVDPAGEDSAAGSATAPLRTLAAARERLRPRLAAMERDLVVEVRGTHYLDDAFVLEPADSGRNGHRVVWRGAAGAALVGGRRIEGWREVGDGLWRAQVPPGTRFQQLFADGVRQTKARHPNNGYVHVEAGDDARPREIFGYAAGDLPPGDIGPEAQVFIWSGYDWFTDTVPIAEVHDARRVVTLAAPTLVDITRRRHRRYSFQGFRGALDAPGEWFLDETLGELLWRPAWPPTADTVVLAPATAEVVALRGTPEQPVQGIVLENLSVEVSAFGPRFNEIDGTHGRTAWNEPANLHGAVTLEHAHDCAVRASRVANAGYSGISLIGGCIGNAIEHNEIRDAGFHGVLLIGYAPRRGEGADLHRDNRVAHNHIHHCGRLVGHGGGVFLHSTGANAIEHNAIHDMPRYGICQKGGAPANTDYEAWLASKPYAGNSFAHNDLYRCNQDSEDSGVISFHTAGHGLLDNNRIHDVDRELGGLSFGIYLDDAAGGFTLRRNVIHDIGGGDPGRCVPIYAKGIDNTIENNILIGEERTGAAIQAAYMFGRRTDHHRYLRNIVQIGNPEAVAWRHQNWTDDRMTACDHNLFAPGLAERVASVRVDKQDLLLDLSAWRAFEQGYDEHSQVADPGFVDAAADDYRLRDDSPAWALGFEPIPGGWGPQTAATRR